METISKTKYHDNSSCNCCGDTNITTSKESGDDFGRLNECATKCNTCGWEDYWAYGFFMSSELGLNNALTYSV